MRCKFKVNNPVSTISVIIALVTFLVLAAAIPAEAQTGTWRVSKKTTPAYPNTRIGHSTVYDPGLNATVLFGGFRKNASGEYEALGETWEWNGSAWTNINISGPPACGHLALSRGPSGKVVLYGGAAVYEEEIIIEEQILKDVWIYGNNASGNREWKELKRNTDIFPDPVTGRWPKSLRGHAMVYDSNRDTVILFGGMGQNQYYAETWELRKIGNIWEWKEIGDTGPSARAGHQLVYNEVTGKTLLFGGRDATKLHGDLWEYDPDEGGWSLVSSGGPGPRAWFSMAQYPIMGPQGTTLVFGGVTALGTTPPTVTREFWLWDGTSWSQPQLPPTDLKPLPRALASGSFDLQTREMVIFGGTNFFNWDFGETWVYYFNNAPPVITHTPVTQAYEGQPIDISAVVTDPNGDALTVTLYYRISGTEGYSSEPMVPGTGNSYSAQIPGIDVTIAGVDYYIEATDSYYWVRHGMPVSPHVINVIPGTGSLQVFISPQGAVDDEAKWRRFGTATWHDSGYVEAGLAPANYQVEFTIFNNQDCWIAPVNIGVDVYAGQTTTEDADYTQAGLLQVFFSPVEVQTQAGWSIDQVIWNPHGSSLKKATGDYTVYFSSVADYHTPDPVNLQLDQCEHRVLNVTYEASATLTVTIDPDKPDFSPNPRADGLWSIDGGTTWHPSGYTLTGLVAGTEVTITLFDLNYWNETETTLPPLQPGPNSATVCYTPYPASLTVTIDPDEPGFSPNPRVEGCWSIDSGTNCYDSGYTLNDLTPFTDVTITLLDLGCWDESAAPITLKPGPNSAAVAYTHQPASLTVTIDPDEPGFSPNPRVDGRWSIDGGTTWHPSGYTLTGLNACEGVTITLSDLDCWGESVTPQTLQPGSNSATVSYTHLDASLTVMIDPDQTDYSPNPRADGRWSIDDGNTWYQSGYTKTGLYACGEVTITYKPLAGWIKPADNPVTLVEGPNSAVGAYTRDTGTLKVNIDQGGGSGSFSITGPSDFTPVTGQTTNYSASVPTGGYTVTFTQETGYYLEITATSFTVTPPSASGSLAKDAVETVTGTYSKVGNLQVFIDPEGVRTEGAAWRRVGTTQWHPHAYIEADVPVGEHTVEFKDAYDVNCWEAPMDATVTIAQDTLTQLTDNYWEVGNIRVTLHPFFIEEGGQWRQIHTDKPPSEWRDTGYVDLSEVVFKPYEIEYSQPNANWPVLPHDYVTLIQCETVDYHQQLQDGWLEVFIRPQGAIDDGAKWYYDSIIDRYSSGKKVKVSSGHHTVRFTTVPGWTKPAPIAVNIYPTITTTVTGRYLRRSAVANSDFNGDGVSDLSYFRPDDGTWHVSGQSTVAFGSEDDLPVPGDYNGDGITERAFFRGADGTWNIYGSLPVSFGQEGDIPAPADYDGDGITDIAVFRPSEGKWYFHSGAAPVSFGQADDAPLPADYNGDGLDDVALFRPSDNTWYIYGQGSVQYGQEGDIPAPADYNGDGFTDIAVFTPGDGVWHIYGIGDFEFGMEGDIPTPGDYDGDGIADIAVFRQSEGKWYIYNMFEQTFGQEGDIPLVRGK
jgi:hypothetical protein